MGIPAVLIGIQIPAWVSFLLSPEMRWRADFRAYYVAGSILRAGQASHLYDVASDNLTSAFIHPAYEAVLYLPLSFLSIGAAHVIWAAINFVLIFVLCRTLSEHIPNLRALLPWLPAALTFSFVPIGHTLMQGQDSLLLALLFAIALTKLHKEHLFTAGILVGLGAFRFQFLIPLIVLFALWRGWRILLSVMVSGGAALLASCALVGIRAQVHYFSVLRELADPSRQAVTHMANIRAVMTAAGLGSVTLVVLVSAGILIAIAWMGRAMSWSSRLLLAICAGCLLSYHFFLHDLSILIIPILVVCDQALAAKKYLQLASLMLALDRKSVV